jgi:type II secretory pathway component GspD/PulD (secretin)
MTKMTTKYWQVIRDDARRTFEVCGRESDVNHFTNSIHGMQRAGMSVTGMTPPVTNKTPNKGAIVVNGYVPEDGLYKRLQAEYMKRARREFEE